MTDHFPPPTAPPRKRRTFQQVMESWLGFSGPWVYVAGGVAGLAAGLALWFYLDVVG